MVRPGDGGLAMKPEWLREVEREHDKLMAEHAYEHQVAHRPNDENVVRKSAEGDNGVPETTTRSEPASPFSDAQLDVLAEVIANLKDEIEELRRKVRAGDVASLHGKIDAMLSLLGGPKENGRSAD